MAFPIANHCGSREGSGEKNRERRDPCDSVEAASGWRSKYGCPEFLYKCLQNPVVAIVALDRRHELVPHAVGVRTADVVTLQQYLVASADAHHAMTKIVEARAVPTGAEQAHRNQNRGRCRNQPSEPTHQSPASTGSGGKETAIGRTRCACGTAAAEIEGIIATTAPKIST